MENPCPGARDCPDQDANEPWNTHYRIKMNSWRDDVNMLSEMCWDTVIVACQMIIACVSIDVGMILGPKKEFNLFDSGVELDPAKAFGILDAAIVDSVLSQPSLDGADSFSGWGKSFLDLYFLASDYIQIWRGG